MLNVGTSESPKQVHCSHDALIGADPYKAAIVVRAISRESQQITQV